MSDICKDIGNIWTRLFDHRTFLAGEINLSLSQFEQKRGDKEVDYLFKTIENITDTRDTEIPRFKTAVEKVSTESSKELEKALSICNQISDLEQDKKENSFLETARQERKLDWESFMDYITTSYSEINSATETKEQELKKRYLELEKQLHILKI